MKTIAAALFLSIFNLAPAKANSQQSDARQRLIAEYQRILKASQRCPDGCPIPAEVVFGQFDAALARESEALKELFRQRQEIVSTHYDMQVALLKLYKNENVRDFAIEQLIKERNSFRAGMYDTVHFNTFLQALRNVRVRTLGTIYDFKNRSLHPIQIERLIDGMKQALSHGFDVKHYPSNSVRLNPAYIFSFSESCGKPGDDRGYLLENEAVDAIADFSLIQAMTAGPVLRIECKNVDNGFFRGGRFLEFNAKNKTLSLYKVRRGRRVSYDYINIHTVTYGFTAFFSQGWQLLKEGFVPGGEMRNLSRNEF